MIVVSSSSTDVVGAGHDAYLVRCLRPSCTHLKRFCAQAGKSAFPKPGADEPIKG